MLVDTDRKYAYQASTELARAIRDYERQAIAFYDNVVKPQADEGKAHWVTTSARTRVRWL